MSDLVLVEKYLSNVVTDEDMNRIKKGSFNVLKAPKGWGKTTFAFDKRILGLSRANKHVIYLIHNMAMRDKIVESNAEIAEAFDNSGASSWLEHRKQVMFCDEPDHDKIQVMCYQTFASLLRREGNDWLKDIDLILWDEFDDVGTYYRNEVKKLRKLLPNFSNERLAAILQEGNSSSVVNFVYQIKTLILDPNRIILLAMSASPENAALHFKEYVNYVLTGQLEEKYCAKETYYINNVCSAIHEGVIHTGEKYWCFTSFIHDAFRISAIAESKGFHPIVLWSEHNATWQHLMTEERKAALESIAQERDLPSEYDMIIITAVGNRGFNVYDTSFQNWICDSLVYEDIQQYMRARYRPAHQYLLEEARGIIEFTQYGFPVEYYEWRTLDELRKLVIEHPIFSKGEERKRLTTFNAVRKEYPELFESRKYGKTKLTQYRIKSNE